MLVKNLADVLFMWDEILHAIIDTLKIFPFLLVVFVLFAIIEQRVIAKKYVGLLGGRFAPLVGSLVGIIPQCGVSVMAVKFYKERCISVGTLLAIFISTSDEALSILIGNGMWADLFLLVGVKIAIAIFVGYLADFILKKNSPDGESNSFEATGCCKNETHSKLHAYLIHPLLHSLKTAGYVLIVNVVLGLIIYYVGEDKFERFMADTGYFQPFVSALVGLIPNCASSVAIVEVYVSGNLTFGALVAGLTANAGIGLALLLKDKKRIAESLFIILALYVVGVVFGEIIALITSFI